MPHLVSRQFHARVGWLMIAGVVVLSLVPIGPVPQVTDGYDDKVAHTLIYTTLMFWFGLIHARPAFPRIAALVFGLGAVLEVCQGMLPYRTASLADAVANGVGVLLGVAAALGVEALFGTGSSARGRAK